MTTIRPHSAPVCECDSNGDFDSDIIDELEKGFTRLRLSNAKTPLRKYLYKRVFRLLLCKRTQFGATLLDVIRVGLRHHDAPIGAYATDQYAYTTFQLLFDPIIKELHFRFDSSDTHPPTNWGDWTRIENLDPDDKYIVSTRIRCSRNLDGFRFTPTMDASEFEEVEKIVLRVLQKLPWEYEGTYIPLQTLTYRSQKDLESDHCYFPEGTKFERTANITRYWPSGRGIFVNDSRTFAAWINEKDHLRVICLEDSGNLNEAYRRLAIVMPVIDRRLSAAYDERLGFLTVSPSNVGTALRLSVFMRLPHSPVEEVHKIAKVYHIDVTCLCGYQDSLYCMSNMRRLGFTEYALTREFNLGIRQMINLEKHHELLTPKGLKNTCNNNNNNNRSPNRRGNNRNSPKGNRNNRSNPSTPNNSRNNTANDTDNNNTDNNNNSNSDDDDSDRPHRSMSKNTGDQRRNNSRNRNDDYANQNKKNRRTQSGEGDKRSRRGRK